MATILRTGPCGGAMACEALAILLIDTLALFLIGVLASFFVANLAAATFFFTSKFQQRVVCRTG